MVKQVLSKQFETALYKSEKCEFHVFSVSLLGYIISQEGMAMDEAKVPFVTGVAHTKNS